MKQLVTASDIDNRTLRINQENQLESRCLVDLESLVLYFIEPAVWCYAKVETTPQSLALMAIGSLNEGELKDHGDTLWAKPRWFDDLSGDIHTFQDKWIKLEKRGSHHQIAYFTDEQPPVYETEVLIANGEEENGFKVSFDRRNPNAGFLIRLKPKSVADIHRMRIPPLSWVHLTAHWREDSLQFLGETIALDGQVHRLRYQVYPEYARENPHHLHLTLQANESDSDPNQIEIKGQLTHIPVELYAVEADLLNTSITEDSNTAAWLYFARENELTPEEYEQAEEIEWHS